jgi:hypothetical protein
MDDCHIGYVTKLEINKGILIHNSIGYGNRKFLKNPSEILVYFPIPHRVRTGNVHTKRSGGGPKKKKILNFFLKRKKQKESC